MSSVNWYYTNEHSPYYNCGYCVMDDRLSMITSTKHVAELPQNVKCRWCAWEPKVDGLIRPRSKHSGYAAKINLWSASQGRFPKKISR